MKQALSRTPVFLLFIISISPILLGSIGYAWWNWVVIATTLFFACWSFVITKVLRNKNLSINNLNFSKFTRILVAATVYIIVIFIYFSLLGPHRDGPIVVLVLIGFCQFLFLYWYIFLINFIAKCLAIVEQNKIVDFSQYAGYFFCLFFFPLGIWWVHPKIKNALAKMDHEII
jgi:hypothetical protein